MSVLVKGMEMPKMCGECPFRLVWCRERLVWCREKLYMINRLDRCPLIELPEKHGGLIDANVLIEELKSCHFPGAPYVDAGISIAIGKVCDASTIIEAEGDEG